MPLTSSQIDRAGVVLRSLQTATRDEVQQAFDVLWQFRAEHSLPLTSATMALRSAVNSCGYPIEVSQRLKTFITIVNKLQRQPMLRLSQLQDVGGCRAVLPTVQAVRAVEQRVCDTRRARRREIKGVKDYIATPRDTGYRAVHIVVVYAGHRLEMQLRTTVGHEWAVNMERLTQKYGQNLREPNEPVVRRYFALISEAMAIEESGGTVGQLLLDEIQSLRESATRHIQEGTA